MNTEDLANKLEEVYKKESHIIKLIRELKFELEDLQEDKEMLKISIKFLAIKELKKC